ncbi:MAG: DUF3667 domain-containing protein [Flavobacteriales bacterium]|nr:DUF3667 domain-containing protein [Flavobacteriales bacterium]
MEPCANCGQAFDSAFCPVCGQKRTAPGIRIGQVLSDFASGVFNAEAPIWKTFREFIVAPGVLTRRFLAGKRKAYSPPVRYFLFGVAYYFVMRWLLNWDPVDSAVLTTSGTSPAASPAMQVNHWMSRNVNLLIPIWLMMLAAFDRLLFPRIPLRWVERLVHYLFAAGTYLLVATTLIPLIVLWPPLHAINFLVIFGLMIWACIALHERKVWNVFKALIMVPISFVLYVMLCSALVGLLLGFPLNEVFAAPGR